MSRFLDIEIVVRLLRSLGADTHVSIQSDAEAC